MKGLFRNSLILMLFLSLVFSIAGVFAAWTYGGGLPTENIGMETEVEQFPYIQDHEWYEPVTSGNYVQYHTYTYEDEDKIYKRVPYTEGGTVPTFDSPNLHSKVTFLGWSPLASHDDSTSSYIPEEGVEVATPYTYRPTSYPSVDVEGVTVTDEIPVNEIIAFKSDTGVIDLYDLYTEYKFTFPEAADYSDNHDTDSGRSFHIDFFIV